MRRPLNILIWVKPVAIKYTNRGAAQGLIFRNQILGGQELDSLT